LDIRFVPSACMAMQLGNVGSRCWSEISGPAADPCRSELPQIAINQNIFRQIKALPFGTQVASKGFDTACAEKFRAPKRGRSWHETKENPDADE